MARCAALVLAWVSLLAPDRARAAVVPRITLDEMSVAAETIVLGQVDRAEPAWSDDGRIIVTRIEVAVERAVKGGPRSRVVFEVPGGRIGDQILVASGAPVFRPGDRVVLFLTSRDASGAAGDPPGRQRIVGWNQGAIRVVRDAATGRELVRPQVAGAMTLDRDGRPAPVPGTGVGPWPLDRFLDEVETILSGRAAGPGVRAP